MCMWSDIVTRWLETPPAAGIPKGNALVFADNAEGLEFWRATGWGGRADLALLQSRTPTQNQMSYQSQLYGRRLI